MDSRGAHSVCRGLFALVRAAEPTGRDSTKVLGVHVNLASTLTAAIRTRQACRRRCAAASRMDAAPAAFPPQGTTSSKSALSAPSSLPSPLAAAKLHVISSAGAAWTTMCLLDPRGGRPPGSVREGSLRSLPVLHWSLLALPARISRAASRDTARVAGGVADGIAHELPAELQHGYRRRCAPKASFSA